MTERTPLDWALVAVAAATIKASEVTVVANEVVPSLPTITIGDTALYPTRGRGVWLWRVGGNTYRTLAEALAEAVSAEALRRVEAELGFRGLTT